MATVGRQNLTVQQGADYRVAMVFSDESGVAMDMTGYTFAGQARESVSSDTASFSMSFTIRTQSGADMGYVDLHIADTDTAALSITKDTNYVYDIEWTNPSGDKRRVMEGVIKVRPEVTR
jgi:hypothetical protein